MYLTKGTKIPHLNNPKSFFEIGDANCNDEVVNQYTLVVPANILGELSATGTYTVDAGVFDMGIVRQQYSCVRVKDYIANAVYEILENDAMGKINVIKLVRELTTFGLKESKDLVDAIDAYASTNSKKYKSVREKKAQLESHDFIVAAYEAEIKHPGLFNYRNALRNIADKSRCCYATACKIMREKITQQTFTPNAGDRDMLCCALDVVYDQNHG